jgi:hypothetical protein
MYRPTPTTDRLADLLLSCMLATSNSCHLSNRGVLYSHAATWSTDAMMLSPKKSKWKYFFRRLLVLILESVEEAKRLLLLLLLLMPNNC